MSKMITYSLFGDPKSFEFGFYLRGCYYNTRMNKILYPEWETVIITTQELYAEFHDFFEGLQKFGATILSTKHATDRCASMLWRMIPIFIRFIEGEVTHVMCRDADSVSTYREANCVYEWLRSGMPYHAINDNDAHAGLMGGLVAFRSEDFKRDTGYTSFEQMISGLDLRKHGSDQDFMNKYIHPKIKYGLFMHRIKGAGIEAARTETEVPKVGEVRTRLWVSDLISRYIGSAGVIDFELLRFFKTFDNDPKFDEFEKKFPDVFYWQK